MMKTNSGIYVHIPFCRQKCLYCDFYSEPCDDAKLRESYTETLLGEIAHYGKKYGKNLKADTVFFGGGTPSLMEPALIDSVIKALKEAFDVAEDSEITMECNPATLTAEKLQGYKAAGVNRLSIGSQSFDDEVLSALGRIHKAADIEETVKAARLAGFDNISLDLMFAVPRQTMATWKESLEKALSIRPEHLSFYSLEIAEGTPFGKMHEAGTLEETDIEEDRKMYHYALERLKEEGYEHYEISNAALAGREAKHNLKYWNLSNYLGLGPSAHSYIGGERHSNSADLRGYIAAGGVGVIEESYINDLADDAVEYTFTALRTKEGVSFKTFREKFGQDFWAFHGEVREDFYSYVRGGYAVADDDHIALTRRGIDISNKIMALFV